MSQSAEVFSHFLRWSSVLGNLSELIGFLLIAATTIGNDRRHKKAEDHDDTAAAYEHSARQILLNVDRSESALRRQDLSGDALGRARAGALSVADIQDARAREQRESARDLRFLAWRLDKRAFYISFGFIVTGAFLQMVGSVPS
jgi:hypothetical protein